MLIGPEIFDVVAADAIRDAARQSGYRRWFLE